MDIEIIEFGPHQLTAEPGWHQGDPGDVWQAPTGFEFTHKSLSVEATNASKSGHPTSCASMAEIMRRPLKAKPSGFTVE